MGAGVAEITGVTYPDWFMNLMSDADFLYFGPPILDAEPMTKMEIQGRRFEGEMMYRYGKNFLGCYTEDDIPMVLAGNPEQVVRLSD